VGPSREKLQKSRLTWREPWIAQRRIRGTEFSTYSIARNGRLIAHAAYESLYRVGVVLPSNFNPQRNDKYALLVDIGGFGMRYTHAEHIVPDTRFVIIVPDGAWPYCDPDQVDTGLLICDIGVAPVSPAELIMISLTQTMTGPSTLE